MLTPFVLDLILQECRGEVRQAPERVITDYVARDFMKLHTYAIIVTDVMFVNNIPFLVTLFRGIKFVRAENIKSWTAKQLAKCIRRDMQLYSCGSMIVQTVLMNVGFDKTMDELSDRTVVNTVGNKVGAYVRGRLLPVFPKYSSQKVWPDAGGA